MAYHPLANDTGGSPEDRRNEADRILKILEDVDAVQFTTKEDQFIGQIRDDVPVSPKQLFWLRDIKDKYL
jgi:hypothetical protein